MKKIFNLVLVELCIISAFVLFEIFDVKIILFLFFCLLTINLHLLDVWSTKVLSASVWAFAHDEKLRNKIVEDDIKKGISHYELNPIGRFLIKKFGFDKGLNFVLLFTFPLLTFLFLWCLFVAPEPLMLLVFLFSFYLGGIHTQILRARAKKKHLKELGYDIDMILKEEGYKKE